MRITGSAHAGNRETSALVHVKRQLDRVLVDRSRFGADRGEIVATLLVRRIDGIDGVRYRRRIERLQERKVGSFATLCSLMRRTPNTSNSCRILRSRTSMTRNA